MNRTTSNITPMNPDTSDLTLESEAGKAIFLSRLAYLSAQLETSEQASEKPTIKVGPLLQDIQSALNQSLIYLATPDPAPAAQPLSKAIAKLFAIGWAIEQDTMHDNPFGDFAGELAIAFQELDPDPQQAEKDLEDSE